VTDEHNNIIRDNWLSEIINRDVYKVITENNLAAKATDQTIMESDLLKELQSKPVFLYSKIPITSITSIKFIEGRGFNLIDTNVIFEKPIARHHEYVGNCTLRFATPEDKDKVTQLSRENFTYSRFHLDSNFTRDLANTIKAEWVKNYFIGERGDTMIIALSGNVIAGFLLLIYQDDSLIIDLIATDNDFRRKGIARDMIVYAETQCHEFDQIRVGTQLANMPSMRFYASTGFKIASAQYTFHYHSE